MDIVELSDWLRGHLGYTLTATVDGAEYQQIRVTVQDEKKKVVASAAGWMLSQAFERLPVKTS